VVVLRVLVIVGNQKINLYEHARCDESATASRSGAYNFVEDFNLAFNFAPK
jgi:hypothetical protein